MPGPMFLKREIHQSFAEQRFVSVDVAPLPASIALEIERVFQVWYAPDRKVAML
jgi:hypothetical protein